MCNRYRPPERTALMRHVARADGRAYEPELLRPGAAAPFIRAEGAGREACVGLWHIVPPHAPSLDWPFHTHVARWEQVRSSPSIRPSWAADRRCIVPAESFYESNYEAGFNTWWKFRRADGAPCGLAGLWNAWIDPASGAVHETYTVLTQNADRCPLMRRMHRTDPRRLQAMPDKRSVVMLEPADWDTWLSGSKEDAAALVRLSPVDAYVAGPAQWLED
jgi:putative SOS response-associated peptidase YedK